MRNESNYLAISNLVSIKGYVPNPESGKYYVALATELFEAMKANNKGKTRNIKFLICTVSLHSNNQTDSDANATLSATYGDTLFVVSPKFMKLSNRQQLILIEHEMLLHLTGNEISYAIDGIDSDIGNNVRAELMTMEKFGYCATKRALKKCQNVKLHSERPIGRYLHKECKKLKKQAIKSEKTTTKKKKDVKLRPPFFNDRKKATETC